MIPLEAYLLLGAALLSVGLWGALSQQSIVMLMMGLELMINGILVSAVAFWFHVAPADAKGQLLGIIVLMLMAVEMALGFAIVIAVYRARRADMVDMVGDMKG
jgi:NAD(P)H-quinone oxidoreductase subunit 4L